MNPLIEGKLIAENYDSAKYHQMAGKRGEPDFVMSRSELMTFDSCPKKWLLGVEQEQNGSIAFGSLVDCLITDAKRFNERFSVQPAEYMADKGPDKGTSKPWNNNADVCRAWKAEQGSRSILKLSEIADARGAEARLQGDRLIKELLHRSKKQVFVTTIYQDADTGITVPIKVLIDLVPDGEALADLKTVRSAAPKEWQRTVYQWDYHVQAAMYLDAWNSCGLNKQRNQFLHVLVENTAPFETARRILAEEFINIGRARYTAALARYCRCLKAKKWPGYDDEGNDIVNGWRLVSPLAYMVEL